MRSMIPEASLKVFRAAALSPAAIALVTLLIALVRAERRLALCLRRFSAWRAALRAALVFALRDPERKGAIVVGVPHGEYQGRAQGGHAEPRTKGRNCSRCRGPAQGFPSVKAIIPA